VISALSSSLLASFAKAATSGSHSLSGVLMWRFLIAAVVLCPWLLLNWPKKLRWGQVLGCLAMGASGYALSAICFFHSVDHLATGVASVLLYTFPAMVVGLNWMAYRETPSTLQLGAVLLAFFGGYLIAGIDGQFSSESLTGVWFGVAAAFFYACYLVAGRHMLADVSPVIASFFAMLGAFLSCGFAAILDSRPMLPTSMSNWTAIFAISLVSTALPVVTMLRGLQLIGPVRASVVSTIEPVCTIVIGLMLWGESLSLWQLLGAVAIVASVLVFTLKSKFTHS
jgi:drug/metabolite transporter (DMT)-like permease